MVFPLFLIQYLIKGRQIIQFLPSSLALENDHFFTGFISCLIPSSVSMEMVQETQPSNFSTPLSVMEH